MSSLPAVSFLRVREAMRAGGRRLRGRPLAVAFAGACLLILLAMLALATRGRGSGDFPVRRMTLEPEVPLVGTLVPVRSDSYGAVVPGVEVKILWLAEEGSLAAPGAPLIQFDAAPFQKELDTSRARVRELAAEADSARLALAALRLKSSAEVQGAQTVAASSERDLSAFVNSAGPLTARESAHDVEQKERLFKEAEEKLAGLEPFVAQGFISREEHRAARTRRDQAAADLDLARARHDALVHQTNPDLVRKKIQEAETETIQYRLGRERARVGIAQAETAVRLASIRLEEAERQAAEAGKKITASTVTARAPGLVVYSEAYEKGGERRKIRAGDAVWGGTTVVTLPDLSRMQVEGRVPESEIHRISAGQRVRVKLDAFPDLDMSGALRSIGSVGASEKNDARSFPVTVALDQKDLRFRPGMIARCRISCERAENVLAVPVEAVRFEERGPYVIVVSALGKAYRRRVITGTSTSQLVQIRQGLREGETVRIGGE
jgi:RND family efflux transporter MFP subunit